MRNLINLENEIALNLTVFNRKINKLQNYNKEKRKLNFKNKNNRKCQRKISKL